MPSSQDIRYVAGQFVLFGLFVLDIPALRFDVPDWLYLIAWVLTVFGALFAAAALLQLRTSLTPWPTPKPGGHLVTTGVFALSRHPIYTGLLFGGIGLALLSGSGYRLLVVLALLVLFYFKSRYEESLLLRVYPAYREYLDRVRRFL